MAKARRKPTPKEGKGPLNLDLDFGFGFEQRLQWQKRAIAELGKSLKRRQQRQQQFEQRLIESLERLRPASPALPVHLKSAKEWVPEVVKPVRDKLLDMGITKAGVWVSSQKPPDGKSVEPRSAEKILRDDLGFPKAHRGSKQRPKFK